ncbi:ATP-binding cassette domain-containing protein [Candidatus Gottesmanbacteria bacterium]|nr:ATP-binding cassette domain-containing protein [Candidatus Gottesmanbacteria bacterium]
MFVLDKVVKKYGTVLAFEVASCEISIDKFVFVMGPSGSGKSTLLRLLSFVEPPDSGVVQLGIEGRKFSSFNKDHPWPQVTCVFQRQFLWPHLTLRQNIALPLRMMAVADMDDRLREVNELFDMSAFIDRFPNEVSGGQAQRAALARALVLRPRLILIDEAHGGLDLEQQEILNRHLVELRATGVGLIVVTHSLEFARRYADQIIVIEHGTITDKGSQGVFDDPNSHFLQRALGLNRG